MKDHYRIAIIADLHIGKNAIAKFRVSSEAWGLPVDEFIQYLEQHDVDLAIVAGDLHHSRYPTPKVQLEGLHHIQSMAENCPTLLDLGNHDRVGNPTSVPASWPISQMSTIGYPVVVVANGMRLHKMGIPAEGQIQVLSIPYPFYEEWAKEGETVEERILDARMRVIERLGELSTQWDKSMPRVVVGHLMAGYGGAQVQVTERWSPTESSVEIVSLEPEPPMLLGKDVVIPVNVLEIAAEGAPIVLGHVHKQDRYYVGSTQPTDFGDTTTKGFIVIEAERDDVAADGWVYTRTFVPFKTSQRIRDVLIDATQDGAFAVPQGAIITQLKIQRDDIYGMLAGQLPVPTDDVAEYDALRIRVRIPASWPQVDTDRLKEAGLAVSKHVLEVEVTRIKPRVERVAVEDVQALTPSDWCGEWLEASDTPPEVAQQVRDRMEEPVA